MPVLQAPGATGTVQTWQPLNRFQQAMALWEKVHPYNAGHLIRLRGRPNVIQLEQAIQSQCQRAGIGELVLDSRRASFLYRPVESIPLAVHELSSPSDPLQAAILTESLNAPFPDEPHHPLRWMLFIDSAEETWLLAAVYHHLASDAHGVQQLLSMVLREYMGDVPNYCDPPSLRTDAPLFHLRREDGARPFGVFHSFCSMTRSYFAMRRAHRLHESRMASNETAFVRQEAPSGLAQSLAPACKSRCVGVNDAFLAALAVALAEHTPQRRTHCQRRKIALANAYNLRSWSRQDLTHSFGTYVGHSVVLVDDPDAAFDSVVTQVAAQTRIQKEQRRPAGPAWPLIFAKYLWPLMGVRNEPASYRKLYPLCAGLSTVRVDARMFGEAAHQIIDYARICPPGPAMPMVLAPTMCGDRMILSLVHRVSALPGGEAQQLVERVAKLIEGLVKS